MGLEKARNPAGLSSLFQLASLEALSWGRVDDLMGPGPLSPQAKLPASGLSLLEREAETDSDTCFLGRECVLLGDQFSCDARTSSGQMSRGKVAQELPSRSLVPLPDLGHQPCPPLAFPGN